MKLSLGIPSIYVPPSIAIGGSLVAQMVIAVHKEAPIGESAALLTLSSILGAWGTFKIGQASAQAAAQEMIRPHARSAFRRVVRLYDALGRLAVGIDERRQTLAREAHGNQGQVAMTRVSDSFDVLAGQIQGHIDTASDAMEDWRDIIPQDVAELLERARMGLSGSTSD